MTSEALTLQGTKFLPLENGYLTEAAVKKCGDELSETPERKIKGIHELRSLLQRNVKSKGIDFCEDFLVSYLRRNKYRVKDAQQQILNLVQLQGTENIFRGIPDECLDLPSRRFLELLPMRCQDGCAVLVFRWGLWDPTEFPVVNVKKMIMTVLLQALRDPMTQINGFKVIHDFGGVSLKHVKYCTPHYLFLLYNGIVNCTAARYKEVYMINENAILKLIWRVIQPVVSEKIKSRMHFLSNNEKLLDYFPSCIRIKEHGGDIRESDLEDWIRRANKEQGKFTLRGQPNYY